MADIDDWIVDVDKNAELVPTFDFVECCQFCEYFGEKNTNLSGHCDRFEFSVYITTKCEDYKHKKI